MNGKPRQRDDRTALSPWRQGLRALPVDHRESFAAPEVPDVDPVVPDAAELADDADDADVLDDAAAATATSSATTRAWSAVFPLPEPIPATDRSATSCVLTSGLIRSDVPSAGRPST
jgi:hypothetical protein